MCIRDSPQVRDVSSWTGNLMLAKAHPNFPSDVVIVLIAANASLTLMDSKGVKVSTWLTLTQLRIIVSYHIDSLLTDEYYEIQVQMSWPFSRLRSRRLRLCTRYVVFDSISRFFMFQLCHSNWKNIIRISHYCGKKNQCKMNVRIQTQMLRSNTGTYTFCKRKWIHGYIQDHVEAYEFTCPCQCWISCIDRHDDDIYYTHAHISGYCCWKYQTRSSVWLSEHI